MKDDLIKAVMNHNVNIVELLLENGADVNVKDIGGRTPLHIASICGYKNIVKLLLEHGADVNVIETPTGLTPLHLSSHFSDTFMTIKLLLEHGANVDAKDNKGHTPLHIASYFGHANTVKLLLEYSKQL